MGVSNCASLGLLILLGKSALQILAYNHPVFCCVYVKFVPFRMLPVS